MAKGEFHPSKRFSGHFRVLPVFNRRNPAPRNPAPANKRLLHRRFERLAIPQKDQDFEVVAKDFVDQSYDVIDELEMEPSFRNSTKALILVIDYTSSQINTALFHEGCKLDIREIARCFVEVSRSVVKRKVHPESKQSLCNEFFTEPITPKNVYLWLTQGIRLLGARDILSPFQIGQIFAYISKGNANWAAYLASEQG